MLWNWQLPDWPKFTCNMEWITQQERAFLLGVGSSCACIKNIEESEYNQFVVEILSIEGLESSKIEGEFLDRESLQSSIRQHFGFHPSSFREKNKEAGMAELLCDVYTTFDKPLTHEMLWQWHMKLFKPPTHIADCGKYRTHVEPMQIVSRRYDESRVFFEAPPSIQVAHEMNRFIDWYNSKTASSSILGRAAIAHLYFESIHPFEDGNGRIGRILVEKALSQGVGRPILIAVSKILENRKKDYYAALERCNRTLEVNHWLEFFADVVLDGQREAMEMLHFLIEKSRLMSSLHGQLNERQEKALLRMFAEGIHGFEGGLSAEKYMAITKASRATTTRDLVDLVRMKALVKTGELRHTRYWLNLTKPL